MLIKLIKNVCKILLFQGHTADETKFINEIIASHNECRTTHQAPVLRHSARLTEVAQSWAEHLARTNDFSHSSNKLNGQPLGENIAMKYSSANDEYTGI